MSWFTTNLVSAFLLPPLCFLLPVVLGLVWWRRLFGQLLVGVGLAGLWMASTPYVADSALRWLEGLPIAVDTRHQPADAIVVLGGGTYFDAPEYGGDTVSSIELERLRYAARLYHETKRPILVSGGNPQGTKDAEARMAKAVLEDEFKVPVRWIEERSSNTAENARYSYEILHEHGIKRIYLVTHAWHMPRAQGAFEAAGFEVVPAPTAFTTRRPPDALAFVPDGDALHDSRVFAHEVIGLLWYRLKSAH